MRGVHSQHRNFAAPNGDSDLNDTGRVGNNGRDILSEVRGNHNPDTGVWIRLVRGVANGMRLRDKVIRLGKLSLRHEQQVQPMTLEMTNDLSQLPLLAHALHVE